MEAITSYLLANWPSLGGFLIVAVVAWLLSSIYHRFVHVEEDVDTLKVDVSSLKLAFVRSGKKHLTLLMESKSPLQLTEVGRKAMSDLRAEDMVARNMDKIVAAIGGKGITNAYDIQEYCMSEAVVQPELLFAEPDVEAIKNFAFATGMSLFEVGNMLGLVVRDAYFEAEGVRQPAPIPGPLNV